MDPLGLVLTKDGDVRVLIYQDAVEGRVAIRRWQDAGYDVVTVVPEFIEAKRSE